MPLVSSKEMLEDAYKYNYAIGAFPGHHFEMIRAIITAAEELDTPVIIQTTPDTIHYTGIVHLAQMVKTAAEQTKIPVSLHLDHGNSFQMVNQALRAGYTSIMIDGSKLEYEDNILLVKQVVDVCQAVGVPVEAELGTIGSEEDDSNSYNREKFLTNPKLAEEFVNRTNIDFLAPAFGTAHGKYKSDPKLDFLLLDEINQRVNIPIVMHGASGISNEDLQKSLQLGISKVNFSTELKDAFGSELRQYLNENPNQNNPRKIFVSARETVKEIVKTKIRVLQGSKAAAV
jgi:fructose-bisphosphate aldolase class II/tagatose 1,6-diphosphate aldolase GatY/KbaY